MFEVIPARRASRGRARAAGEFSATGHLRVQPGEEGRNVQFGRRPSLNKPLRGGQTAKWNRSFESRIVCSTPGGHRRKGVETWVTTAAGECFAGRPQPPQECSQELALVSPPSELSERFIRKHRTVINAVHVPHRKSENLVLEGDTLVSLTSGFRQTVPNAVSVVGPVQDPYVAASRPRIYLA